MTSPVSLKIRFKSDTLEQFVERYAVDVSDDGIFIRTTKPLAVGTGLNFEFQLQNGDPLLSGQGTVVWVREQAESGEGAAAGMGLRFDDLPPASRATLRRLLEDKEALDEFADRPTKVAQAPAALLEHSVQTGETIAGGDVHARDEEVAASFADDATRAELDSTGANEMGAEAPFGGEEPTVSSLSVVKVLAAVAPPEEFGGADSRTPVAAGPTSADAIISADELDDGEDALKTDKEELERLLFADAPMATTASGEISASHEPEATPASGSGAEHEIETDRVRRKHLPTEVVPRAEGAAPSNSAWFVLLLLLVGSGVGIYYWKTRSESGYEPKPPAGTRTSIEPGREPIGRRGAVSIDGAAATQSTRLPVARTVDLGRDATQAATPPQDGPAPPKLVSLAINSTPTGARIRLAGADTGKVTPATIEGLEAKNPIEISFELPGKAVVRIKTVPDGKTPLAISLQKNTQRSTTIESEPKGATVVFEGKKLGKTPLEIQSYLSADKQYELRLEHQGYVTKAQRIDGASIRWQRMGDRESTTINVELEKKEAKKSASAAPPTKRAKKLAAPTKQSRPVKQTSVAKKPAKAHSSVEASAGKAGTKKQAGTSGSESKATSESKVPGEGTKKAKGDGGRKPAMTETSKAVKPSAEKKVVDGNAKKPVSDETSKKPKKEARPPALKLPTWGQ
jgi:uncharacterized protein (TIGR02266 family)